MRNPKLSLMLIVSILLGGASRAISQSLDPTTPYYQKIVSKGYDPAAITDLSEEKTITIDEPSCAYINITNVTKMPTSKTADMHALFECYDGNGHYFKKKVILNAQGNSSMGFVKKNFAADFCEDEWLGNETTKITIGNWVKQDAFHFKAFYTDYFRGIGEVGYKLFDDIIADRPSYQERAGLTDYDSKARCYPGGFPCVVYLNGNFYGIFAWQLKKHRDNMSQKKSVATNIHLDGVLDNTTLFRGTVDWTQFEIRNPKTLYCTDTEETEVQKEYKKVSDTEKAEVLASGEYTVTTTKPSDLTTEQIA